MPLKDIFVHVDNSESSKTRLKSAINLAVAHEAHLTGIYVAPPPKLPRGARQSTHVLVGFLAEAVRADAQQRKAISAIFERARLAAESVERNFREQAKRAGIAHHWIYAEGDLLDALALHARFCDVLLIRQPSGEWTLGGGPTDRLIMETGLATLVVPTKGTYPAIGQRIMIAWDRSPLATRAVNNARPFLRLAKEVKILSVNLQSMKRGAVPGSGIVEHLDRHGIKATALRVTVKDPVLSDVILSRAKEEKTDLLVMGAYGSRGLRERILGGVTSTIIEQTAIPVLLSH
jgi:nucleotide-binding universal stress UspA family protein